MNYYYGLLVRIALCFLPLSVYLAIFTPLTLYTTLLFFPDATLQGITLTLYDKSYVFIADCIAPLAYFLLFLLVMLTADLTAKERIKYTLFGFWLIFFANIIRIVFFILLSLNGKPFWFDTLHLIIWHFVSGLYVAGVWIFLVTKYHIKAIPVYTELNRLWHTSFFASLHTRKNK